MSTSEQSERAAYNPREAGALLGRSREWILARIAEGKLKASRPTTNTILITPEAIAEFLRAAEVVPGNAAQRRP